MTKQELFEVIKETLGIKEINTMIKNQITRFVTKHGYTYKDIGRAIYFFVVVEENEPEIDKGIGIVPFVKDRSEKYFEDLKRKKYMQEKQAKEIVEEQVKNKKVFYAKPRERNIKNKYINMEDL